MSRSVGLTEKVMNRRNKRMWPKCSFSDIHMRITVLSDAVYRASMLYDRPFPSQPKLLESLPSIIMFNGCVAEYLGRGTWDIFAKRTLCFGLLEVKRAILTGICVQDERPHVASLPIPDDERWKQAVMKELPVCGIPVTPGNWITEYLQADSVDRRQLLVADSPA